MEILVIIFALVMILNFFKEMFFILLIEMNFYFFKKRCNRFLEDAKEGTYSRNDFATWFNVEQKAYKKRQDRIDDLYNVFSLKKER